MKIFRHHLHAIKEVTSIAQAANAKRTDTDNAFVEAQTHITSTDWQSSTPPWANLDKSEKQPLATLPAMLPQQLVRSHRGSTDMFFTDMHE